MFRLYARVTVVVPLARYPAPMRHAPLALVVALAFAALARAEGELDKQYLARRNQVDEKVATGLLGFAKSFERKSAGERARAVAGAVRFFGSQAQILEAQDVIDAVEEKPTKESAPDVEAKLDEAVSRYKKSYEEIVAYCEKRSLAAEGEDAKQRISRVTGCSLGLKADAAPSGKTPDGPAVPGGSAPSSANDQQAILERVQAYRKAAGLKSVELDQDLSKGCQAHCNYLVVNDGKPELEGLKAHEEVMSLPAATPEGEKAGKSSDIAWGDSPAGSVDMWMASFYHRVPILRPELEKIGAGFKNGTKFRTVCVLDVLSSLRAAEEKLVVYPPDKATGVPVRFSTEMPDPIPQGAPHPAGYPVTLTGYNTAELEGAEADLFCEGKKVDCHFSSPQKPATSFTQQNSICLIPKSPLAANAVYTAKFRFTQKGQKTEVATTFSTGR
jgi:uncharacterized protein YkwD